MTHTLDQAQGLAVAHTLRGEGFDASEDGTGRGTPLVPVAFGWQNSSSQGDSCSESVTPTLDKSKTPAIAFAQNQRDEVRMMEVAGALAAEPGAKQQTYLAFQSSQSGVRVGTTHATLDANNGPRRHNGIIQGMAVRRLTPRECERLQGFPDDYTDIRPRGKDTPDGPRYKALGNSMAVPVMAWIGRRIAAVAAQEELEQTA